MKQSNIKHLTLLHSNDMHGDFLAEEIDEKLVGGVALLSGYINQVRRICKNTLYMVAGDMFRGSLIDTEYQGISTIEIMNLLGPDVVSLGNHELDYGIAHLLFLERCCKFPIVNANIYINPTGMRLFDSHKIFHMDGMNILVMGLLTEDIMTKAEKDRLLGSFVNLNDAAKEVGIICNSYKDVDIDFTIVMTHIGFKRDMELAKALDPKWGVDVIVGGHSHTLLEEPEKVNDILIVQAGIGTNQIGRFEIDINTDTNGVEEFTWEMVPIDDAHCNKNEELEKLILNYKKITDEKYGAVLTHLLDRADHPARYQETRAGNLFCDALKKRFRLDFVMLGSGSFRTEGIGPMVTVGDLIEIYPYEESLVRVCMNGKELRDGLEFVMKNSVGAPGSDREYYQFSCGFHVKYSLAEGRIVELTLRGKEIKPEEVLLVGMESFHYQNIQNFMGISLSESEKEKQGKIITGDIRMAIEEYLKEHTHIKPVLERRSEII